VRVLLDTHALRWFLRADRQLSQRARALISDAETIVDISPASYWEIAIKMSLGK